jgi:TonB-linked SusC/RagA family outer membrane protein
LDINNIHHFSILVGTQLEYGNNSTLMAKKTNLILQDVPSLQTATGVLTVNETLSHKALEGYFGRFSYNYNEKYMFESNVRYDGSYVYRNGDRWGLFPSFSLGWNVNKERFWQNIENYINTLKLRASWGQLGNQNISPYSDLELLPLQTGTLNWIFGAGTTGPIGYTTTPALVNTNLTWETATTTDIGANMSFFKNKLTFDVDIYQRLTTNMVGPQPALPGVLGASVPAANNATLRTRGWELALGWKQNFESGFSYFINANLSNYNSVVKKYYNPTGTLSTWYAGREVGEIWGFKVNDLFRTQEDLDAYKAKVDMSEIASNWNTGDIKIEDINGDGKITRGANTITDHGDQMKIGNSEPRYLYGIDVGASFKGFDFSMLWSGIGKRDLFFDEYSNIFWGNLAQWWQSCLQPRTLDYYRDVPGTKYSGPYMGDANINTDAYFPRPYSNATQTDKNRVPSTRYLQNGSYARLKNIQLGYSLPKGIISKLKLEKLRVAISVENLLTLTKLPAGIDPVAPVGYSLGTSNNPVFGEDSGLGRMTYGGGPTYSFLITVTF